LVFYNLYMTHKHIQVTDRREFAVLGLPEVKQSRGKSAKSKDAFRDLSKSARAQMAEQSYGSCNKRYRKSRPQRRTSKTRLLLQAVSTAGSSATMKLGESQ